MPVDSINTCDREAEIRKWFLLTHNLRPDSIYVADEVKTLVEANAEAWKGVLVSLRVMEKDEDMRDHVSIFEFSSLKDLEKNPDQFRGQMEQLTTALNRSAPIFQPGYSREFVVDVMDTPETGKTSLILGVVTMRTTPAKVSLDDFGDIDYVPDMQDILTNDIAGFPFPSVFDFISEINRPPDPLTMGNLGFSYKVTDLKYDLEKMKKKKNPQEVVDSINCKLTRLQFWKDVLEKEEENLPDPFTENSGWSERVQKKFQSMQALKDDPKKVLDTQYDRKAVFVKVIEQWSDRLKRSFKFYYQPKSVPEDFIAPILRSKWRNEVLNTTKIFSQATFLGFEGPDFTPGSPPALFDESRYVLWGSDYAAELALYEMVSWMKQSRMSSDLETGAPYSTDFGSVVQHTYSRGLVTERVLRDTWQGIARFLDEEKPQPPKFPPLSATDTAELVSARSAALAHREEGASDHTGEFLATLRSINSATRQGAVKSGKSVKQMFKDLHYSGKDFVEWWTTLVRDLDMTEQLDHMANEREKPWSDVIDDIVTVALDTDIIVDDDSDDTAAKIKFAEDNSARWLTYRDMLKWGEELENVLYWRGLGVEHYSEEEMNALQKKAAFDKETVHVDFVDEMNGAAQRSIMIVAPRFFRGNGHTEELSAFLEYSQIVSHGVKAVLGPRGVDATVIPLHPLMINQNGTPDYGRRAPHPALIIRFKK